MKFKLLQWTVRQLPDKFRRELMIVCMLETALVLPGQKIDIHLEWNDKNTIEYEVK